MFGKRRRRLAVGPAHVWLAPLAASVVCGGACMQAPTAQLTLAAEINPKIVFVCHRTVSCRIVACDYCEPMRPDSLPLRAGQARAGARSLLRPQLRPASSLSSSLPLTSTMSASVIRSSLLRQARAAIRVQPVALRSLSSFSLSARPTLSTPTRLAQPLSRECSRPL